MLRPIWGSGSDQCCQFPRLHLALWQRRPRLLRNETTLAKSLVKGRYFDFERSSDLLKHISESLAGRVGILELTPSRRLLPYHANLGKRLVKSPKLYVRDSGILHHLLGIASPEQLLSSPARGGSFEGFMIEQLTALEKLRHPGSAFYYFRTQTGAEIALIIDRGQARGEPATLHCATTLRRLASERSVRGHWSPT